ncbi:MAG TPA: serine hydrolase domain-containing protein [bacterium]|nr:serine hydrolase domain-containing protein [bacterium]
MARYQLVALLLLLLTMSFLVISCGDDDDDDDDSSHDDDDDDDEADDDGADDDDDDNDDAPPTIFDQVMQAMVDEYRIFSGEPGFAVGVTHGDEPVHMYATGQANIIDNVALTPDMHYRVGSITKPFTATVIMQLVEEGTLSLDDPLTKYLPQYSNWSNVRIRHLISMQSGLPDYLMSTMYWINMLLNIGKPITPERIVSFVRFEPINFEPGEACSYCNTNFILLGMIAEAATGLTMKDMIRERVVEPLGLTKTFLDMGDEPIDDLVHGYADAELAGPAFGLGSDLMLLVEFIPEEYLVGDMLFDGTYMFHPTFSWTTGALVSFPEDLVKFMKAYVQGELVGPEMYEHMMDFTACDVMGETVDYSYGMMRKKTRYGYRYGHGGKHFGYSTDTYYMRDYDVMFTLLHNFVPDQNRGLIEELVDTVITEPQDVQPACTPPEGFFDGPEAGYVHVAFKGTINDISDDDPIPAISNTVTHRFARWRPYYGIYAQATCDREGIVTAESYGPSTSLFFDWRGAFLQIDPRLALVLNNVGQVDLDEDTFPLAVMTLRDVLLDDDNRTPLMRCVTAVPDTNKPAKLYVCDGDEQTYTVGETLRVFGSFAVDRNLLHVYDYLAEHELEQCECRRSDGTWVPCGS